MTAERLIADEAETTEDGALNGRLRLRQPRRGHRFGHDAVLLGASVPARAGDRVVEFGCGVGLAGLAVASRVSGIGMTLVERDPSLAALARENAAANGIEARVAVLDVTASARDFAAAGLGPEIADHALMNPPYNDARAFNPSPDTARADAHAATPDTLATWIRAAAMLLAPGGTVTLIWRAEGLATVLSAVERRFGGISVLPVHPRPGAVAIRILVGAVKGTRAPFRLLPGLVLANADGHPSPEAEAILRHGGATALAMG